jgi:hypothetical protein
MHSERFAFREAIVPSRVDSVAEHVAFSALHAAVAASAAVRRAVSAARLVIVALRVALVDVMSVKHEASDAPQVDELSALVHVARLLCVLNSDVFRSTAVADMVVRLTWHSAASTAAAECSLVRFARFTRQAVKSASLDRTSVVRAAKSALHVVNDADVDASVASLAASAAILPVNAVCVVASVDASAASLASHASFDDVQFARSPAHDAHMLPSTHVSSCACTTLSAVNLTASTELTLSRSAVIAASDAWHAALSLLHVDRLAVSAAELAAALLWHAAQLALHDAHDDVSDSTDAFRPSMIGFGLS